MPNHLTVAVVDDDKSVRESLPDLLRWMGFEVQSFSSGEEFLESEFIKGIKCVILDVAMPGMSGFDLQKQLKRRGSHFPVIFITASRDESIRARALEQGAIECLFKPFSDTALLQALNTALHRN